MAQRRRSFRRELAAHIALIAPWALALGALVAADAVRPLPAAVAAVAAAFLSWIVGRYQIQRMAALIDYIETLADPAAAAPAPGAIGSALGRSVAALIRRQTRRQREALARLATADAVFEGLPEPVIVLDDARLAAGANRAARQLFGADITGRDLAATLRHPKVLEAADAVLAGAGGRAAEFILATPVERNFIALIEPLGDPAAEAAVLLLHDMTDVRRAEQTRADFVANASHELRTPLSTLIGFVETLKGPARDDAEARNRFLGLMQDQATRMANLVNDLLALSRIELNEHSLPSGRIGLLGVLRRVCNLMEIEAHSKNMTLALRGGNDPESSGPEVFGDEEEMTQIFQNLISNAVKYGAENTAVDIEIDVVASGRVDPPLPPAARHIAPPIIRVRVRDRGDGIAPQHISRLTERFYRVDTARSRALGGTGLGLAIVKHIVSHHRGALSIESELGKGSLFTVYLPAAPLLPSTPE